MPRPGGQASWVISSTDTAKVWEASSTARVKFHSSSWQQTPDWAKSCRTGPQDGSCASLPGRPLLTEIRKLRTPAGALPSAASHLTCTKPRPLAFWKEAPPLRSDTALGQSMSRKVPGGLASSKGGDTAILSRPRNFLASTVQRTWSTPSGLLALRIVCGCGENSGVRLSTKGSLGIAMGPAASLHKNFSHLLLRPRSLPCPGSLSFTGSPSASGAMSL
mmetsp:Transcript_19332/g.41079  ORF Transcript_19332/g.41079 Transcript_19332/m.41079 type:complete len:219 (-) Transcript_19332:183-839(-)